MIMVLADIREVKAVDKDSKKSQVVFVHTFVLDNKLPQNKEYEAATFQVLASKRLEKYTAGEYYTFSSVPLITAVKKGK